ncbi:hypothetical protein BC937DRAFT_91388 [Endogone sp. FLAS-F59071]|nr:hypothetical protein BC937DRAFT_91388 [Endogone sp. FLAS-F59071]|eukprot:RUS16294.1 hypothetical protein BC937DRAFT_91388 [Endogone sp. FLAS-F59071]
MHDMLVQLVHAAKNDPSSVRQLRTVGWLHFDGLCEWPHLSPRRKLHHVGQGMNPGEIAATLSLLTAVLQSRYIIEEVYNVIKKISEDLNEELLLNIINKTGSSLESPKLFLLPSMLTPKK